MTEVLDYIAIVVLVVVFGLVGVVAVFGITMMLLIAFPFFLIGLVMDRVSKIFTTKNVD